MKDVIIVFQSLVSIDVKSHVFFWFYFKTYTPGNLIFFSSVNNQPGHKYRKNLVNEKIF